MSIIKSIEFKNFRNLSGKYQFSQKFNVLIGKNNSGKTNLLDGITLAFFMLTGEYFRIEKSDFRDSDDTKPISIKVELTDKSIASLSSLREDGSEEYGFIITIQKSRPGRYSRKISLLNGNSVDFDTVSLDPNLPNIHRIPLIRIEDVYSDGLSANLSDLITTEDAYETIKNESKKKIKEELKDQEDRIKDFSKKFGQDLSLEIMDPKISNEKIYIVDGDKEHNKKIGAGYRSIVNIFLNTINNFHNIILVDEIENHLHPSLLRMLLREINGMENIDFVATTHSSVVVNELELDNLIDLKTRNRLGCISNKNKEKIEKFLHPGRAEMVFAEKLILVEGYTEEIILKNYLIKNKYNWSIVNVAGIMFEPYIELAKMLDKKNIIVISDNDISLSRDKEIKSSRYNNLHKYCTENGIRLLEVNNTLESDLYDSGVIKGEEFEKLLETSEKNQKYKIARDNKKMEIAWKIIKNDIDISNWHIIKEIINEFESD